MANISPQSIGLAMGGGGARALAHIGVLEVFQENNIPISFIAGTSMGAMIGGAYAAGIPLNLIKEMLLKQCENIFSVLDFKFQHSSLVSPKKMKRYWWPLMKNKRLEDCQIHFEATAVDLETGEELSLKEGPLFDACMASAAYPPTLPPVYFAGRYLIDGGILNSFPVDLVRPKVDILVGISIKDSSTMDFISAMEYDKFLHVPKLTKFHLIHRLKMNFRLMSAVFMRSVYIANQKQNEEKYRQNKPDILIEPDVGEFTIYDFGACQKILKRGRQAAEIELPKIRNLMYNY